MHNILLVARREFLEQVRKRAFILSTVLIPALFALSIGVSTLVNQHLNTSRHIAVVAADQTLAAEVRSELQSNKTDQSNYELAAADRASLVQRVQSKQLDGFYWIEVEQGKVPTATYESLSSGDFVGIDRLRGALSRVVVRGRLSQRGIPAGDVDSLLKDVSVDSRQISAEGREVKSNALTTFFKGYIMAILLMISTMMYGMNVARSIIQEKTSRIYEVVLSIAEPGQLLAGKLIGTGAVGMLQLAIWVVAAGILATPGAAGAAMAGKLDLHFQPLEGVLFVVYFVLGYLLNASIFAGLSASCETEQDLQMYAPITSVPLALSFSLIMAVVSNPNSALSLGASLFPLTAPIIMMFRMGAQMPPIWQFVVSIALMLVSIWGALTISARLYRVGILMYGKRATLPELIRWLKAS